MTHYQITAFSADIFGYFIPINEGGVVDAQKGIEII